MSSFDSILLTSFGGPEGPDEVMPYLERVTAGRGIPRERLEEVSHHYMALGGVSPINEQNRALLAAMRERFPELGINLPIYWGNRNSEPYFADVLKEMYEKGHRRVLAWVTSAYSSYSGCRQYRENLQQALIDADLVGKMSIEKVRHYFDHPGFLQPMVEDLVAGVREMTSSGMSPDEIRVLFSTHSIPNAMGETSGPPSRRDEFAKPGGAYEAQHLRASSLVIDSTARELGIENLDWALVYQSRSGSPEIPWLEPDVNDAIESASEEGKRGVIVVPIGFVSDHVEVIWDLDNEAKETAENLGLAFYRAATSGTHPAFVNAIGELISERLFDAEPKASSDLGPWPNKCAVGCCPNLRRTLPALGDQP
ncbi:MAG: ferrochelatase [Micrococcales bacterium]